MARITKAQAKRLLKSIKQKARKLTFEYDGAVIVMNDNDLLALMRIINKCEKRLK